jgi:hypothetical protein
MEFGGWKIHHRTEDSLLRFAMKAGVDQSKITIETDQTGVNLFLHIEKPLNEK